MWGATALTVLATTADLLDAKSLFIGGTRAADIELTKLIESIGASRASYSVFADGERLIVTSVSVGGVEKIPKANTIVSLQDGGYDALYLSHVRRECFTYEPKLGSRDSLGIGLNRVGARLLVSYPTYASGTLALKGAVAVSFDSELPQDVGEVCQSLKATGIAIEGS